jgi:hypothetical protein
MAGHKFRNHLIRVFLVTFGKKTVALLYRMSYNVNSDTRGPYNTDISDLPTITITIYGCDFNT